MNNDLRNMLLILAAAILILAVCLFLPGLLG